MRYLSLSLFYRLGSWGPELAYIAKTTQSVSSGTRIKPRILASKYVLALYFLNHITSILREKREKVK